MKTINYNQLKQLLDVFFTSCKEQGFLAWNMSTNQQSSLFDYLLKFEYGKGNYLITRPFLNKENKVKLDFLISYEGKEKIIRSNLSITAISQKLDLLMSIGFIDIDKYFFVNKGKFLEQKERKMLIKWSNITKKEWNRVDLVKKLITNEIYIKRKVKKKRLLSISYILNYFFNKVPPLAIQKITDDPFSIKKIRQNKDIQQNHSIHKNYKNYEIAYVISFISDEKNNFTRQINSIEERDGEDKFFDFIKDVIVNKFAQNHSLLSVEKIDEKQFENIKDDLYNYKLRKYQSSWRGSLINIRKAQGRKFDDLDKFKIDESGLEAAHIISAKYYKEKIIKTINRSDIQETIQLYFEYQSIQNGLILDATTHKKLDNGELVFNLDKKELLNKNNGRLYHKIAFIPSDSFLVSKKEHEFIKNLLSKNFKLNKNFKQHLYLILFLLIFLSIQIGFYF